MGFSAEEPDRLRGPQFHRAWCDELAAWKNPETFDQLMFGLRLGTSPRCIITTTPKPSKIIKNLMSRDDVHTHRGSTFDNAANLAPQALEALKERYAGTNLGRLKGKGSLSLLTLRLQTMKAQMKQVLWWRVWVLITDTTF